jgi:hypothetical protein
VDAERLLLIFTNAYKNKFYKNEKDAAVVYFRENLKEESRLVWCDIN